MLLYSLIAIFALFPTDPTKLTIPIAEAAPSPLQTERRAWLDALEACEDPTGDPNVRILDINNRYSYGVLQFQMGTWLRYSWLGATADNIYDKALQEEVASYMLDHGGADNWWTCSRKVEKRLGAWPS